MRAGCLRTDVKDLVLPPKIHLVTREQTERVNPHVVLQFSWGNAEGYEVKAIDEMMNRVLVNYPHTQPGNDPPGLGFLLRVRTTNKRNADGQKILRSIDVYRVRRGTTVADAKANRNGASHQSYRPGQTDVLLEITPQDVGIAASASNFPPVPFQISAAEFFSMLQV